MEPDGQVRGQGVVDGTRSSSRLSASSSRVGSTRSSQSRLKGSESVVGQAASVVLGRASFGASIGGSNLTGRDGAAALEAVRVVGAVGEGLPRHWVQVAKVCCRLFEVRGGGGGGGGGVVGERN